MGSETTWRVQGATITFVGPRVAEGSVQWMPYQSAPIVQIDGGSVYFDGQVTSVVRHSQRYVLPETRSENEDGKPCEYYTRIKRNGP